MKTIEQRIKDWRIINLKLSRIRHFDLDKETKRQEIKELDLMFKQYFKDYGESWTRNNYYFFSNNKDL